MGGDRRGRHDRVSARLAACSDAALVGLLAAGDAVGDAVGVVDVGGVPVFTKRIPITDRELARPHSTANLFDVPLFCQYGMFRLAGPGFSVWRELAANIDVTEAVLAGGTEAFPLLHHWRVLPGRPPVIPDHRDLGAVVDQFGGDPGIRARLEALAGATHSLVLFGEYLPTALFDGPTVRPGRLERQLFEITGFLRRHELLHMDGHPGNMRADAGRARLVDFGLAVSPRFDLSAAERAFVARHTGHDADYAAMRLVNWLVTTVCGVAGPVPGEPAARDAYVRRCAAGDLPGDVPESVAAILARHAPAAARMNDFCRRLWDGDLTAVYPAGQARP
ncbi:hypothetical protein GCM10010172_73720 [Paractinoplanes ferrugineus]|uniref:Serine/threonine protein phosphatase n=1 Tax=Paractinoplanes ferrugineus TaxID=113564 RepID=A0A919J202_9ACTN|nr:serine/threonine protein phosphatase [Actinoplanes ferrugineus]GIE11473.1 hypothetical protein Afe05nite_33130 [Actinoplanes ferrugineus]